MTIFFWKGKAKYNILVFAASIFLLFYSSLNNYVYVNMGLLECIILYILMTHSSRREMIPALSIIVSFKLLALPFFITFFDKKYVQTYTVVAAVYDIVLIFCLSKFYRSKFLRLLFNVDTPDRKIHQIQAIIFVLTLNAFLHLSVWIEVMIHKLNPHFFAGIPFFYGNYGAFALSTKFLMLLAIWSMCLDCYYVDYERYRRHENLTISKL